MACRTLQWRHIEGDGVSNYRLLDCLLNLLFRRRSKKTPKLHVTDLCEGIHRSSVNSPHKGSVTGIFFAFDDVIMEIRCWLLQNLSSLVAPEPEAVFMTTSWHGNAFHITVHVWRESTSDWWIPFKKDSNICGILMCSLMLAWTSCWQNSWVVGDFRRHCDVYDKLKYGVNSVDKVGIKTTMSFQRTSQWYR